jgi:hypothetical protein
MDGSRPRPARRLTIVELVVLVAAVAAALPVLRLRLREERGGTQPIPMIRGNLSARLLTWDLRALPLLAAVAPALLVLRFRGPRRPGGESSANRGRSPAWPRMSPGR